MTGTYFQESLAARVNCNLEQKVAHDKNQKNDEQSPKAGFEPALLLVLLTQLLHRPAAVAR